MRAHPLARSALIGATLGVVVGAAFYLILRAFGTDSSPYLFVAIVLFFIPGYTLFSMQFHEEEVEEAEWKAEEAEQHRTHPPTP
jgi:NhaP-type Na+/H+ or K+/H+ antiporter